MRALSIHIFCEQNAEIGQQAKITAARKLTMRAFAAAAAAGAAASPLRGESRPCTISGMQSSVAACSKRATAGALKPRHRRPAVKYTRM